MRIKNRLFARLFFTTAAAMLICVTLSVIILSIVTTNHFLKERKQILSNCSKTVSEHCANSKNGIADSFLQVAGFASISSNADVFILNTEGRLLVCSCSEWKIDHACTHSIAPIDINSLPKDNNSLFEFGNLNGAFKNLYYTAVSPVNIDTENGRTQVSAWVFSMSKAASLVSSFHQNLRWLYIASAILTLLFIFVIQYISTYRITRPLRQMSRAALRMASGDFSRRIPVTSNDELGELATAFNQMSNSLSRLETTRRSFIGNVSHELKTPITTMGGFIDGIIDGTIPPEKQPYYLKIISEETKRLARVVESMLSLAKLESGNAELNLHRFDISALLCAVVVGREQKIVDKKIDIRGLDTLSPTYIHADRDLIHQVVYNLVDNAVKFTNIGGYIEFSVCAVSNGVKVRIKNSGKGISADSLPLVFERFYKEDKSRSQRKDSTGLGLYIAKTIINIHGGSIRVSSQENEYVEFEFTLP